MSRPVPVTLSEKPTGWELLPFRFYRFDESRVLLTNMVGEHVFVSPTELESLTSHSLKDADLARRLRGKHFIRRPGEKLPVELLAMKARTRYRRLADFTALHMFVVTLRCEHACPYCQVSRRSSNKIQFDMSEETADRALDMTFRSPSPNIKIEFQGGEPLLNMPLVESIVQEALRRNALAGKNLAFVIATNLALLDEDVLEFAARFGLHFSTSLDGPETLHNANRPRPGGDSWTRATNGIRRIQQELGRDSVSALMTTTEASLARVREIIDTYAEMDLSDIFLRPLSPYGFAIRTKAHSAYDVQRWLSFYEEGLDYIIDLNRSGTPMVERFATIVLKKLLTNDDPGYVDLMSPSGIGIAALVYNYDGYVYASDEGRMLAEMGDHTFRLGSLHRDSYSDIMTSPVLLDALEESFAMSAPMCTDCAFECYCGADPVFHHATAGDFLGRKPESAFCQRNMGVYKLILDRYERDPFARELFRAWSNL